MRGGLTPRVLGSSGGEGAEVREDSRPQAAALRREPFIAGRQVRAGTHGGGHVSQLEAGV